MHVDGEGAADALALLGHWQEMSALALFVVVAVLVWTARGTLRTRPLIGFVAGICVSGLGWLMDNLEFTTSLSSSVFTNGFVALGVSIMAAALVAAERPHQSSVDKVEPASWGDAAIEACMAEVRTEMESVRHRRISERHRNLLLKQKQRQLMNLIEMRRKWR